MLTYDQELVYMRRQTAKFTKTPAQNWGPKYTRVQEEKLYHIHHDVKSANPTCEK